MAGPNLASLVTDPGNLLQDLPRAHGGALGKGRLRAESADFQVEEQLGFEPDGEGDHRLLWVRKRDANTEWVARRLAQINGVSTSEVGFAGLKDRRALTSQWFSVPASRGPEPDWSRLAGEGIEVLEVQAHRRKLRRGVLWGNRFQIRVRDLMLEGGEGPERQATCLDARLSTIRDQGVPNYFGEQRFGRGGANLLRADALLRGELRRANRHERGLWLSAARSEIFNRTLARRLDRGDWARPLPGDCLNLDGCHSFFRAESIGPDLAERCERLDLHPTGPLWGRGDPPSAGEVRALEQSVVASLPGWGEGLARFGLAQERRPLRLPVRDLDWAPCPGGWELTFRLPAGAYATAVLRELITWRAGADS